MHTYTLKNQVGLCQWLQQFTRLWCMLYLKFYCPAWQADTLASSNIIIGYRSFHKSSANFALPQCEQTCQLGQTFYLANISRRLCTYHVKGLRSFCSQLFCLQSIPCESNHRCLAIAYSVDVLDPFIQSTCNGRGLEMRRLATQLRKHLV